MNHDIQTCIRYNHSITKYSGTIAYVREKQTKPQYLYVDQLSMKMGSRSYEPYQTDIYTLQPFNTLNVIELLLIKSEKKAEPQKLK